MMSCCENSDRSTPHIPVPNQGKYTSGFNSASGFPKVYALIALIIALLLKHLLLLLEIYQVIFLSIPRTIQDGIQNMLPKIILNEDIK